MGSPPPQPLRPAVRRGLVAASLCVITSKDTKLGLDLSGGTELIYQGRPTPQNPEVQGDDIDRSIEIIRDRTDSLGVSEPEISRIGTDSVRVGLPDVQNAERAIDQVGDTAQLFFYDWEPNVIPNPNAPDGRATESPFPRLYDAVEARLAAGARVLRGRVHDDRAQLLPLRRRRRRS